MPSAWRSSAFATTPTATRAAVSRALARSRIGRASVWPYFCMPARSAWPGPGPGQRGVAGLAGQLGRVDRVGGHHGLPLGPFAVADPDRDRAAERHAVPDAAEDLDLVLLERHPGTPAVPEPAPGQVAADVRRWSPRRRRARPRARRRAPGRATPLRSTSATRLTVCHAPRRPLPHPTPVPPAGLPHPVLKSPPILELWCPTRVSDFVT